MKIIHVTTSFFSAVIPVAAATMTPLPLLTALIIMKIRDFCTEKKAKVPINDDLDNHDIRDSIIKTTKLPIEEKAVKESDLNLYCNVKNINEEFVVMLETIALKMKVEIHK